MADHTEWCSAAGCIQHQLGFAFEQASIASTGKIAVLVAQAIEYSPGTAVMYIVAAAAAAAVGLARAVESRLAVDFGP